MFRSDIPIMIVLMTSSVAWDVMRKGIARAHDGLMMLLTVGRNHTLRLVVFYDGWIIFNDRCYIFYDGFYIFYVGWMYHVCDGFIYLIVLVSWT